MFREILSLILVWFILTIGLFFAIRPLVKLEKQTRSKHPEDLSELPFNDLPSELIPLIQAINIQINRTEKVMADRRAFIDDASHQLRTPVSILRMQLDYALRENDMVKKIQHYQLYLRKWRKQSEE